MIAHSQHNWHSFQTKTQLHNKRRNLTSTKRQGNHGGHKNNQRHQADVLEPDPEADDTRRASSDERASVDVHGRLPHEPSRTTPQCRPTVPLQPGPCAARVGPRGGQRPTAVGADTELPMDGRWQQA